MSKCDPDIFFHPTNGDQRAGVVHDWRLWKRETYYIPDDSDSSYGVWPAGGFNEVWYCTRCRLIQERKVAREESP